MASALPEQTKAPPGLEARLRTAAATLGFDALKILRADAAVDQSAKLDQWLAAGMQGDMGWMDETRIRRAHPKALWPDVRSIIMLGVNYGPDGDPLASLGQRERATISVYARNRDYHDLIKGRLKLLAQKLIGFLRPDQRSSYDVKVFVDTAPVMEKPLAMQAGLGWAGKHTNLVAREFGSWLFLGSIFTTLDLAPDVPEKDHCGSCRACLDACPTNAFPAPYQLDARRCISYLTIEHKGPIPKEFRAAIGNRVYGCDDCLAACPWNKFAVGAHEAKLRARTDLAAPPLAQLAMLDDTDFRAYFSGNPIKRIGHTRFLRNVLIAIGNSGDPALAVHARTHLVHSASDVRGAAIWALSRLLEPACFAELAQNFMTGETDPQALAEWTDATGSTSAKAPPALK